MLFVKKFGSETFADASIQSAPSRNRITILDKQDIKYRLGKDKFLGKHYLTFEVSRSNSSTFRKSIGWLSDCKEIVPLLSKILPLAGSSLA